MKLSPGRFLPAIVLGLTAVHSITVLGADEIQLKLLPTGAMPKMGGYMPQRLALSAKEPPGLKQLPVELRSPLFGTLKLGPPDSPTSITVVVDEPEGKASRLFVDANANGDLTDDPAAEWKPRSSKGKNGLELTQYSGGATVQVMLGSETTGLHLPMYRFDKNDPSRASLKDFLFYYADYAREGEVMLGGKTYKVLLADRMATGDFRGKTGAISSGVQLMIDANEDGKFDSRNEAYDVRQPFNIGGTTYEVAGLTPGGERFRIEKSSKTVAEKKTPVALAIGKSATPFKAKTTDGDAVDFPAGYKGKLVLLDFWAMWCPPCLAELPHLTAAYQEFHPQGFEVLGISLDREGDGAKLAEFRKQRNLPWPQVFDGKYWKADIAVLYDVHAAPTTYLVDGDTGLVLASGSSLRGTQLEKTLEAALAKKKGK